MTDIDYEPLTEEEALGLLPKGEYPAIIIKAENKYGRKDPSKSYVVLTVDVKGNHLTTWCALPYMLKHAADSTGNSEKYQSKQLNLSDFVNKKCNVKIKVQEGTEQYPTPKNVIWDFVAPKRGDENQETIEFNDSVPF